MQRCAISWEHVWILSGPSAPTYVSHIRPTWHRRNQGTCQASSLAGLETSAKFVIPHDFAPWPVLGPHCIDRSETHNGVPDQVSRTKQSKCCTMAERGFWTSVKHDEQHVQIQQESESHEMSWNIMNSIFRWFQKLSAQTTYTWTLAKLAIYSRSVNAGRDVPQQAFALCRKRPQK